MQPDTKYLQYIYMYVHTYMYIKYAFRCIQS